MAKVCYNRAVGTVNPGLHLIAERSDVTALEPSYREIPVKGGYTALIDPWKYEEISAFTWEPLKHRNGTIYAVRRIKVEGRTTSIMMHRQILGLTKEDHVNVSHIRSRETLDNRESNLIIGTHNGADYRPALILPKEKGVCPVCGNKFKTYPCYEKTGKGKYCSRSCASKARTQLAPVFVSYLADCEICGARYNKKTERQKYCSPKCQKRAESLRYETNDPSLSKHVIGEIAEHKVIIDLLRQGYWVFKPVVFGCGFDYIAIRGEEIEKVEVKAGRIQNTTRRLVANRPGGSRGPAVHTLLAIVVGEKIVYERREKKKEKIA